MIEHVEKFAAVGMVAVALAVLSLLAYEGNEQAQGALIAVVSAGTGYFLRGKIQTGG